MYIFNHWIIYWSCLCCVDDPFMTFFMYSNLIREWLKLIGRKWQWFKLWMSVNDLDFIVILCIFFSDERRPIMTFSRSRRMLATNVSIDRQLIDRSQLLIDSPIVDAAAASAARLFSAASSPSAHWSPSKNSTCHRQLRSIQIINN